MAPLSLKACDSLKHTRWHPWIDTAHNWRRCHRDSHNVVFHTKILDTISCVTVRNTGTLHVCCIVHVVSAVSRHTFTYTPDPHNTRHIHTIHTQHTHNTHNTHTQHTHTHTHTTHTHNTTHNTHNTYTQHIPFSDTNSTTCGIHWLYTQTEQNCKSTTSDNFKLISNTFHIIQ